MSESVRIPGLPEHVVVSHKGFCKLSKGDYFLGSSGNVLRSEGDYKNPYALVVEAEPGYVFEEYELLGFKAVPEKQTYIVLKFKKPVSWDCREELSLVRSLIDRGIDKAGLVVTEVTE